MLTNVNVFTNANMFMNHECLSKQHTHTHTHSPAQITSNLNATNSVHFAAAASLLLYKFRKLPKKKHVLHFRISRQKHAKTHVNRLNSFGIKKMSSKGEEKKIMLVGLTSFP